MVVRADLAGSWWRPTVFSLAELRWREGASLEPASTVSDSMSGYEENLDMTSSMPVTVVTIA